MARIELEAKSGALVSVEVDPDEAPSAAAARLDAALALEGGRPEPPPPDPKTRPLTLMEQWVLSLARTPQGEATDRVLVYLQLGICKRRKRLQFEKAFGLDERASLEQLRREEQSAPKFAMVNGEKHRAMFYDVPHGIDRIARAAQLATVLSIAGAPAC